MEIRIHHNISAMTKGLNDLQRREIPRATARALNRVADQAKTQASREIRKRYNVAARAVGAAIALKRASPSALQARLSATGKAIKLYAFGARGKPGRPVTVEVIKGQRKVVPGAFIITTKSGHKGVFARGKYGASGFQFRKRRTRKGSKHDLPITELVSISVPRAFGAKVVIQALQKLVRDKFEGIFANELAFRLGRL